jgi:putative hemolysin
MFTVDNLVEKHYPKLSNRPWLKKSTVFFLRYILKEKEINNFGEKYPHLHGLDFVEQILEYFHVSYSTRDTEKENIPSQGKLVIIANNPTGSLDGLALIKLISEVRRDIKVVANETLMSITPLHSLLLPINNLVTSTEKEQLDNIQAHLHNEGVLIIFPAGEVSRLKPQGVRDSRWHNDFLNMASNAQASLLPIFIDGKNSPLFYTVSMLYKPLATLMLVREMFKQRTKHLPMRVGEIIPYDSYNNRSITSHQKVQLLQKHLYRVGQNRRGIFTTQKAIALPENRQALSTAIRLCEKLGSTSDDKDIYLYRYQESSPILREIGRLREIAFRAVGEGTYRRRDIDQYDNEYYHLILWDKNDLEIVGAYRFGDAKRLTQEKNKLYSATLFNYNENMQPYFEQGLELGRSFIQPKYWGKRSLDYLWYGIGAFLKHRPQYRYLFGPVSLSDAIPSTAKDLLVCFYQLYFATSTTLATPNVAYQFPPSTHDMFVGDNYKEDFAKLKSLMRNMGVAIPTLYKQYTELFEDGGVQFIDFSVDPDFNHCVDGLVLTDLHQLKEKRRKRYMGG